MTSANRKQRAQLRELPSKWAWLVSALYVKLRQLKKNTKRNKKRQEDFFGKLFSLGFHYVAIFRNRLETESQSMFCTSFGSYNGRILNIFRVKGLILSFWIRTMAEVQSLSSCCKIHKRQMRSSNKKGAEDKYFGLFTPQKDNKYNIKKTVYFFLSWSSEQTG